jgi:hypothetical protein
MHQRLALLVLALLVLGCERYRSRAQGPFPRQPGTAKSSPAPAKAPLVLSGPTPAPTPGGSDEMPLVPPRPPESGAVQQSVSPPLPPKPPVVSDESVAPVAGVAPQKPVTPMQPRPAPSAASMDFAALKKLARTLSEKLPALGTYEARFTRRENIDGNPGPLEEVAMLFRAKPMSVYMKNVGQNGKGREILYNPTQHGEKIYVVVGDGDTRFFKSGTKVPPQSPDSPQVRSKSRHSIRESGIARSANKFLALVEKVEAGKVPADLVKLAGRLKRDDLPDLPVEGVEQTIKKGEEDGVPAGGTRHWFIDAKADSPSFGLPVLVILYDPSGKELEYYRYTQVKPSAKLTDADFDPARLGRK